MEGKGGKHEMSPEENDFLEKMYREYWDRLLRCACARLRSTGQAQDIVQDVFHEAINQRETFLHHPNPGGWLRKTLQHKISHALSHRAVRARRDAGAEALDWLPAPDPTAPLEALLPRQLSDRDKALLTMAYEEGLTYQEMGRRLGVPPATCGTWLYRARQRCKHYLTLPEGGYPHENDPPHSPRGQ